MNELVEGSDLYTPKVQLDQVVLPKENISTILETVESYECFRRYRNKSGLEQAGMPYVAGLVLLLCGDSGTGKTMTGKRQEGVDADADLRGLFRETDMSNAVLFFDECENIFRQRESGGDRLLNALLTEIERYEGIVFLATNRPFDLDEAMHRRITAVFEFKSPDHIQRRKIWDVLLLRGALQTDPDIDLNTIALKMYRILRGDYDWFKRLSIVDSSSFPRVQGRIIVLHHIFCPVLNGMLFSSTLLHSSYTLDLYPDQKGIDLTDQVP
ncbi:hypothetical protein PsorP6_014908 [Peronosclerospora sorghi]|uniref:Uncharacterized protein n=1 Tax=Peronosclerospora sorghi TaxID=230839 RepID=A0ACC0VV76_9STRA|nr:hypothetical protein PsorP6_014908 [Peronosclerospora sorghi]